MWVIALQRAEALPVAAGTPQRRALGCSSPLGCDALVRRAPAVWSVRMSMTDLAAVAARRNALARELADLESALTRLQGELDELSVTERVLRRLDHLSQAAYAEPEHYAAREPVAQRALGMVRSLLPRRP